MQKSMQMRKLTETIPFFLLITSACYYGKSTKINILLHMQMWTNTHRVITSSFTLSPCFLLSGAREWTVPQSTEVILRKEHYAPSGEVK